MVKKLIFKNSSGTIIQEEDFNYMYPEDWEALMDPDSEYAWVKSPKGFKIKFIVYDPETQTLIYKCRRLKG